MDRRWLYHGLQMMSRELIQCSSGHPITILVSKLKAVLISISSSTIHPDSSTIALLRIWRWLSILFTISLLWIRVTPLVIFLEMWGLRSLFCCSLTRNITMRSELGIQGGNSGSIHHQKLALMFPTLLVLLVNSFYWYFLVETIDIYIYIYLYFNEF